MSDAELKGEKDEVVAAARELLRRAARPASHSATAQVFAPALDRLRAAVGALDALSSTPVKLSDDEA